MKTLLICCFLILVCCTNNNLLGYDSGDLRIQVSTGENWLHDYPLFLGLTKENPPQFAIWITDSDTNYLTTLFATNKIAHENWISSKGNRRKESLPFWVHNRGVIYDDGLYLPTKKKPLTDGISAATPKSDSEIKFKPDSNNFIVFAEFNHSIDFNETFKKSAKQGDPTYSGGEEGSGQPAVIYAASINMSSDRNEWQLTLIGHSSPDGSDGTIYKDTNTLTSALKIVEAITISRK